jgi:hypothetical protein
MRWNHTWLGLCRVYKVLYGEAGRRTAEISSDRGLSLAFL